MKYVNAFDEFAKIMAVLEGGGAFLTVKSRRDEINVMTIGWSLLGIVWSAPILMVAVKFSRHTFQLIEHADDFTVTYPFSDMYEQLLFCGTHSGRNIDKFKACNLNKIPAQKTKSPIIEAKSARYYECKIAQATAMNQERLDPKYVHEIYQDKAYHTYYFGEILACYEK